MRFRVQIPEYPGVHTVTGFKEGRGADGAKLLLAEATIAVARGVYPCTDLVTLMYLHDAVARVSPWMVANPLKLYGRAKRNQALAAERIAGADVQAIPDPAGNPVCPACGRPDELRTVGTLPAGFQGCACCAQPWTAEEIIRQEG